MSNLCSFQVYVTFYSIKSKYAMFGQLLRMLLKSKMLLKWRWLKMNASNDVFLLGNLFRRSTAVLLFPLHGFPYKFLSLVFPPYQQGLWSKISQMADVPLTTPCTTVQPLPQQRSNTTKQQIPLFACLPWHKTARYDNEIKKSLGCRAVQSKCDRLKKKKKAFLLKKMSGLRQEHRKFRNEPVNN